MIALHSIFPELAQREVCCIHVAPEPDSALPADEYAYAEFYSEVIDCDCRRVNFEVISKATPEKVFASISYGWEKESFYRKRMALGVDIAHETVRGFLDPLQPQSEFAPQFLEMFRRFVLDEPYRLRLRRHYRTLKEELARRAVTSKADKTQG